MKHPGTLIHYGSKKFSELRFNTPQNAGGNKPTGGFWTSPEGSEYGWKNWCAQNDFRECEPEWSIRLDWKTGYRLLVIDSRRDLMACQFYRPLHCKVPVLDFEWAARNYDAIWLTSDGEHATRHTLRENLYGWACETVLILNPGCIVQL